LSRDLPLISNNGYNLLKRIPAQDFALASLPAFPALPVIHLGVTIYRDKPP